MKRLFLLVILVALGLVGYWAYEKLFPNDQTQIRNLLRELANTVSAEPTEGNFAKIAKANQLPDFFSTNVVIRVDLGEGDFHTSTTRRELAQNIMAARAQVAQAKVNLLDIKVQLTPDKEAATAHMTLLAELNNEKNAIVQEMKMILVKEQDDWRIQEVHTIKTLR